MDIDAMTRHANTPTAIQILVISALAPHPRVDGGLGLSLQRFDYRGNLAQIVVQLMIATWQETKMGLWNRLCKQFRVCRRRGVIREAMEQENWHSAWELLAQSALWRPRIAGPAT